MNAPPPPPSAEHLRLLSLFHYVWAAMGIFGFAFLVLHYGFMSAMMSQSMLAESGKPPPPHMQPMMGMFKWFYVAFGLYGITTMVLNALAAKWLRARRNWVFCMVVAGINCLSIPLGTVLGVFTIVVLAKDPVRLSFR